MVGGGDCGGFLNRDLGQGGSSKAGKNIKSGGEEICQGCCLFFFSFFFLRGTLCTATLDHFLHFLDKRRAVGALEGVFPAFAAEGGAAGALSVCSPRAAAPTL